VASGPASKRRRVTACVADADATCFPLPFGGRVRVREHA
jgi:hypothetical protein